MVAFKNAVPFNPSPLWAPRRWRLAKAAASHGCPAQARAPGTARHWTVIGGGQLNSIRRSGAA
eukprot:1166530-Alexandrium_andersonii.AAC.1